MGYLRIVTKQNEPNEMQRTTVSRDVALAAGAACAANRQATTRDPNACNTEARCQIIEHVQLHFAAWPLRTRAFTAVRRMVREKKLRQIRHDPV